MKRLIGFIRMKWEQFIIREAERIGLREILWGDIVEKIDEHDIIIEQLRSDYNRCNYLIELQDALIQYYRNKYGDK